MARHLSRRRRNPSEVPSNKPPINPADGLQVAKVFLRRINAAAVVGGGLAMLLHGFNRSTSDVDLYSMAVPDGLKPVRAVTFGGNIYNYKGIPVDVIVRGDSLQELYEDAIACRLKIRGLPVPDLEHLAIIKLKANRGKDMIDFRYLITHPNFSVKKATAIFKRLYPGRAGQIFAEDFMQDVEVERFLAKTEKRL